MSTSATTTSGTPNSLTCKKAADAWGLLKNNLAVFPGLIQSGKCCQVIFARILSLAFAPNLRKVFLAAKSPCRQAAPPKQHHKSQRKRSSHDLIALSSAYIVL